MSLNDLIRAEAARLEPQLVEIRRHLHAHPELSFREHSTSAFIQAQLRAEGIALETGIAGTGIVATVHGQTDNGRTVALRGDMDALPIREANQVPYCSTIDGVMHACGHDVHSTCALGAAIILHRLRAHWAGKVSVIFQPGEEVLPGGASIMIKEGVVDRHVPAAILAQHVFPSLEVGKVGFRSGMYMASTDEVYLTVHGKGGHGAMPHECIDPVLVASHIIIALQQVASRHARPGVPTVLSFGKVTAAGATNVIPDTVEIEGTFRTMDEPWRTRAHDLITQIATQTAEAMGGRCTVRIERGYPCLVNDPGLTAHMRHVAEEYLGADNVTDLDIRMTAEDFAFFAQQRPACFYRLGTGNRARGITSGVHTSTFDIDEAALPIGAGLMAAMAVAELRA
jgi:amidohydrolase